MKFDVTFRNLSPREEVKHRAGLLYEKLARFIDEAGDGKLIVTIEHGEAGCELTVRSYGETYVALEEDQDLRTALDRCFHTMENTLRRAKERRTAGRRRGLGGEWEESEDLSAESA